MKKIILLDCIIFLAAFLLFQIELIISKLLLPKFGGSYLVWGAAMVFFQATLLLGYLYSHFVVTRFGITRYRKIHIALVALPLLTFLAHLFSNVTAQYQLPLVLSVFLELLKTVGPVFFVLSTTGIIFQSWLAASDLPQAENPYALYGISNLGSFLGLLTYPFFFEALFGLDAQLRIWQVAYVCLVALHLAAFKFLNVKKEEGKGLDAASSVGKREKLYWFLLSTAATMMFLAVTNMITYEIAPMPLLWIIPLSIYLISFVLNFKKQPWCPEWINEKFHLALGFSVLFFFLAQRHNLPLLFDLAIFFFLLFWLCMFCQSQLYRSRPQDSRSLTLFYLVVASGGFFGGILVSWIIPLIPTTMMLEYLAGLVCISLALLINDKEGKMGFAGIRFAAYPLILLIIWPWVFKRYDIFGLILIFLLFKFIYNTLKASPRALNLSLIGALFLAESLGYIWTTYDYIYCRRNYYGIYKIDERKGVRYLTHGNTIHGAQYTAKGKEEIAITYYHRVSPIGRIMTSKIFDFKRIGVIGLGTGTLAAYANAKQEMDFFELDPDVYKIATKYFTFLKNSQGKLNFVFQDARLALDKIRDKRYDLLVVDAFSGDSIPVHLLTTEAISIYKERLTPDGIVIFHISNRYLEILPVLMSNAKAVNAYAYLGKNRALDEYNIYASRWVALTWGKGDLDKLIAALGRSKDKSKKENLRPWTDKYSNLLRIVKYQELLSEVKKFRPFYW